MAERDSAVQGDLPVSGTPLRVRYAAQTHTGLMREHNEDDFLILPESGIFVIADGMGGHNAGREASAICVHAIDAWFNSEDELLGDVPVDGPLRPASISLARAFLAANRAIYESAVENPFYNGMGTTVVGVRLLEDAVAIAHAGDSRAYLFRDGRLRQVTEDHSLSNFLYALGRREEAHIAETTMSNVIMRALGLEPSVQIDAREEALADGDVFLLCSDGLSDLVSREMIGTILEPCVEGTKSLEAGVEELVARALEAGGRDNITVILLEVTGVAEEYTRRAHQTEPTSRRVVPVSEAPPLAAGTDEDDGPDARETLEAPAIVRSDAASTDPISTPIETPMGGTRATPEALAATQGEVEDVADEDEPSAEGASEAPEESTESASKSASDAEDASSEGAERKD